MNEKPSPATLPPSVTAPPSKLKSPLFVWPAALALAGLLYFGIAYLVEVFTHESTDDAFIAAHIVSLAPRITGAVAAVHVNDNQLVRSNDLLVEIDPTDFEIALAQKNGTAESQQASYKTALAAYELMRAKVTTAEAAARKARADGDAAEATAKKAQADFDRAQELRKQNTTSQAEFDAAQAANNKAQADWKSALASTAEQASRVDEADRTLAATLAQVGAVLAQWHEAQTNTALARLNLSYTKVLAPADGRVTRKSVEAGDYLQAGQQIMSLVPPAIWVVANFKESQLRAMSPGQPATVEIDALGGRKFAAHVDSIQAGSGAAFSLLPPENATGNFVKVVQRVPVKIVFDEPLPADKVIGPGLSVTPSVRVSQLVFPTWASALIALLIAGASALVFIFATSRKPSAP